MLFSNTNTPNGKCTPIPSATDQQLPTKYSIKYQVYYFLPSESSIPNPSSLKLRRIQVSLDKSKSLQYNLKKWLQRLKFVPNHEVTQEQLQVYKLYKYELHGTQVITSSGLFGDDEVIIGDSKQSNATLRPLSGKDFSQHDILFIGKHDQQEHFLAKMNERNMRKLMGEEFDDGISSLDEGDRKKQKTAKQIKTINSVKAARAFADGDEMQINDEDFEDQISLSNYNHSISSEDSSIMEVHRQQQQKPGTGRKRGRPPKIANAQQSIQQQQFPDSVVAHTVSSNSIQNINDNSSNNNSMILDEEDDYTGFDDISVEGGSQQTRKMASLKKANRVFNTVQLGGSKGQVQRIFQSTKINPANITYSQIACSSSGKQVVKNLNEIDEESFSNIKRYLDAKRITEYRSLVQILNTDVFEKHFKFTIAIDSFPSLEIDGSQTMLLRCFKHHKSATQSKIQASKRAADVNKDLDDELEENVTRELDEDPLMTSSPQFCPLTLDLKTTVEGYWQLEGNHTAVKMHHPYLQHQPPVKKAAQKLTKGQSNKFEEIINRSPTSKEQQSGLEFFEEDFKNDSLSTTLIGLNSKLKKPKNSDEISYIPASNGIQALFEDNDDDEFFQKQQPLIQQILEKVPEKSSEPEVTNIQPTLLIQQPQNTVKIAENVQVDVIDSHTFINLVSNLSEIQQPAQKLNFKKNITQKKQQIRQFQEYNDEQIHQQKTVTQQKPVKIESDTPPNSMGCWFINDEERLFHGSDYSTRDEDLHKLIRFFKQNFTKGDFCRYETNPDEQFDVKTLIFSTEQMKERYLIYRDVLMLCPCLTIQKDINNEENGGSRFKLVGLCYYGVNSNGRNIIFAVSLLTPGSQHSLEFSLKQFFYYMGKLPKAVVIERNQFGFESFQAIQNVLRKEFQKQTGLYHSAQSSATSLMEPRVLYCTYSVQKDIGTRFDFLKREEQQLYQLLVSLPFVDDPEELELKLREVQKINWGQQQQLENIREFLRKLVADRHLWAYAY